MAERSRVLDRVAAALGQPVVGWQRPECGLSAAERWATELADGSRVFVKAATDADTAGWLRNERTTIEMAGSRFAPSIVAWIDDGPHPILVTEDLSNAYWPAGTGTVRWRNGDIATVLDTLEELRTVPGEGLRRVPETAGQWAGMLATCELVRAGLCTDAWIRTNGAVLIAADRPTTGYPLALVHGDVRSDNLCIGTDGRVRFVDWSHAGAGHPLHDLVTALPTFRLEGGPRPSTVLSEPVSLITSRAGRSIARTLGDRSGPEWLQTVLRRLALIELQWVCDVLGLAPPDDSRSTGADVARDFR